MRPIHPSAAALALIALLSMSASHAAESIDRVCAQYSPGEAPPFHDCSGDTPLLSAINPQRLPNGKKTSAGLYLTAEETNAYLETEGDRALFVDIRTRPEANFLGIPTAVDALVPYLEVTAFLNWEEQRNELQLEPNPAFVAQIQERLSAKGLDRDAPVILICRSGTRSAKAANLLTAAGFSRVFSVVDGYEGDQAQQGPFAGQRVINGWKNARLPWSYALPRHKLTMR